MRRLFSLIVALLAIILFAAGALLLVAFFLNRNDPLLAQLVNFVQERGGTPVVLVAGVGAVFMGMVLHFWSSFSMSETQHFFFNTDLGGVGITLNALEQFITKQAKSLDMVENVKPRVTTSADGKRLRLRLETHIIATGSVKNVTAAVQEAVVNAIRDGLGLTEVETVDVDVVKISTPKGGLPAPPAALPAAAESSASTQDTTDADEADHPVS